MHATRNLCWVSFNLKFKIGLWREFFGYKGVTQHQNDLNYFNHFLVFSQGFKKKTTSIQFKLINPLLVLQTKRCSQNSNSNSIYAHIVHKMLHILTIGHDNGTRVRYRCHSREFGDLLLCWDSPWLNPFEFWKSSNCKSKNSWERVQNGPNNGKDATFVVNRKKKNKWSACVFSCT